MGGRGGNLGVGGILMHIHDYFVHLRGGEGAAFEGESVCGGYAILCAAPFLSA